MRGEGEVERLHAPSCAPKDISKDGVKERDMVDLEQSEADAMIGIEKHAENADPIEFLGLGRYARAPLISVDEREKFILDVRRGRVDLLKGTNQLRARQVIVLLRLDYHGPPHRNPDDEVIDCPHLHVYREGFADKWAQPLPDGVFSNLDDHWQTVQDFMQHCNVTAPPNFQRGLFQ